MQGVLDGGGHHWAVALARVGVDGSGLVDVDPVVPTVLRSVHDREPRERTDGCVAAAVGGVHREAFDELLLANTRVASRLGRVEVRGGVSTDEARLLPAESEFEHGRT